ASRSRSSSRLRELGVDRRVAPGALVLDGEMAGVEVPAADLVGQGGVLFPTTVEAVRAARAEVAALRLVDHRRRLAGDRRQASRPRPVEPRDRAEQPPCVGVLRVVEDLLLVTLLDDAAR